MSTDADGGSSELLPCQSCGVPDLGSYDEFHLHHLQHIRSPAVTLVKLSDTVFQKICREGSYNLQATIARKSSGCVSPLKISLRKEGRKKIFEVVPFKKSFEPVPSEEAKPFEKVKKKRVPKRRAGVEGNKLLERFGAGAGVSIQRKPSKNGAAEPAATVKKEASDDAETEKTPEVKTNDKEKLLERLSGIGGISFGKKGSKEEPEDVKPTAGLSIASKSAKPFDFAQYSKILKEKQATETKTPAKSSGELLAKLSGFSGISFVPKGAVKAETSAEAEKKPVEPPKENATEEKSDSEEEGSGDESESEEEEGKEAAGDVTVTETKGAVRVSNNLFAVKKEEATDVKPLAPTPPVDVQIDIKENIPEESGVNILERLTDKLGDSASQEDKPVEPAEIKVTEVTVESEDKSDGEDIIMEREVVTSTTASKSVIHPNQNSTVAAPSPTPSEQLHPDFIAPPEDCASPAMNGQVFQQQPIGDENEVTALEAQPITGFADVSGVSVVTYQPVTQEQAQVAVQQPNGVTYGTVDTTTTSMAGGTGTLENAGYWTEVAPSQQGLEQPQQDPLMTGEGNVSQAFLQNYLGEQQGVQHAIPQDGSEYMALERLGQGLEAQQQQQGQAVQPTFQQQGMPPGNAPMEQLAQQVQRIQGTPPQINVIPQHHMQAAHTMAPQMHPGGLTMQQQQQLAAQQGQTYDQQLMQPPMPNLYPAYGVYNQNFSQPQQQVQQQQQQQVQQQPQFQVPQAQLRPPMLQPRPQIQARPFQSMAAPRARFGMKRSQQRMPSPRQMTPPKQRRTDDGKQGRPSIIQNSSPTRMPSGVTLTPPKKTAETNKVANALASRGITMTSNRQQQQPQQQTRSPGRAVAPTLNLGPGVSITPSSANRSSGGFAVPSNRRPVINHNVERPGPCATVDLTIEDDPPPRNRLTLGRFPCNMCGKIFTSPGTLENHKNSSHRSNSGNALPFKCDRCSAAYPSAATLTHHKTNFHKNKSPPDLAIPVVDLNQPGTRDQLLRAGITNYIPLSQLQSNSNGHYGLPILHVDPSQDKASSTLNSLGAANILALGKLKPFPNR